MRDLKKYYPVLKRYVLPFGVIFLALLFYVVHQSHELELLLRLTSKNPTYLFVFYDTGSGFSETQKEVVRVKGGLTSTFRFKLPHNTKQIRCNPATDVTSIILYSAQLAKMGNAKTSTNLVPENIVPGRYVEVLKKDDPGLHLRITGEDPQLFIAPSAIPADTETDTAFIQWLPSIFILSALCVLLGRLAISLKNHSIIRLRNILIGVVLIECLAISCFSDFNLHPDEYGHLAASQYYKDHWFKKAADDPEMTKSIMPGWGFSYLHHPDIIYFWAEKITEPMKIFIEDDYLRYRFFNFALFFTLILLFSNNLKTGPYFLLALGITPQLWYLFSYFNGDAVSMFSALLLGYYFVKNRQKLQNFFWNGSAVSKTIFMFIALASLVLLTRLHYAIFTIFLFGLLCLLKPEMTSYRAIPKMILRIILVGFGVLLIVNALEFKEQFVNNFNKFEVISQVIKDHALPTYTKEAILDTGFNPYWLYFRDLGVEAKELLTRYDWLSTSAKAFLGVYGQMLFFSSMSFYWISGIAGLGAISLLFFWHCRQSRRQYILLFGYLIVSILAVFVQSFLHSWIISFQAQGRYLFALIPMIAVILSLGEGRIPVKYMQRMLLAVYAINAAGYAVFGVLPMLGIYCVI